MRGRYVWSILLPGAAGAFGEASGVVGVRTEAQGAAAAAAGARVGPSQGPAGRPARLARRGRQGRAAAEAGLGTVS